MLFALHRAILATTKRAPVLEHFPLVPIHLRAKSGPQGAYRGRYGSFKQALTDPIVVERFLAFGRSVSTNRAFPRGQQHQLWPLLVSILEATIAFFDLVEGFLDFVDAGPNAPLPDELVQVFTLVFRLEIHFFNLHVANDLGYEEIQEAIESRLALLSDVEPIAVIKKKPPPVTTRASAKRNLQRSISLPVDSVAVPELDRAVSDKIEVNEYPTNIRWIQEIKTKRRKLSVTSATVPTTPESASFKQALSAIESLLVYHSPAAPHLHLDVPALHDALIQEVSFRQSTEQSSLLIQSALELVRALPLSARQQVFY